MIRDDDSGQTYGTAGLYITTIAAVVIWDIQWLAFSVGINMMLDFFNGWIEQGWVTSQSNNIMLGLTIFWGMLSGLVLLAIILNLIVKAQALKEVRG
jgi:hypothetical protein